ncbi:hypothetical protein [Mumia zhuanghuii]|uniref:Uncharacterized protein n=1 Tax=Mumia zhuanghuii TaxID=2585211 RepID=A0A5C4M8E5_9ACTN|nr:hypothetical protein [Mumia zhuanghuii]TNC28437.1 hypothetical protein FHE65_34010 [Mumia zhuanghuii]
MAQMTPGLKMPCPVGMPKKQLRLMMSGPTVRLEACTLVQDGLPHWVQMSRQEVLPTRHTRHKLPQMFACELVLCLGLWVCKQLLT